MKALRLRQPWADLVVQGKKTMELRNWTVSYRGPLAIHASQTVDEAACRTHGLNPQQVTTGALIGVVELAAIQELDELAYDVRKEEHKAQGYFRYKTPLYGWTLANPRELPRPIPYHGRMGLFNVPDELLKAEGSEQKDNLSDAFAAHTFGFTPHVTWDVRCPFELRVISEPALKAAQTPYRLALYQRLVVPPAAQRSLDAVAPIHLNVVSELGGDLLKAIADQLLDALRQNGYQATDLSANRREPFTLKEETGVRLGLLFMAVRPITKMTRVEAISMGIRAMTSEELYYWYSKCTSGATAERAQKALRILLSDE